MNYDYSPFNPEVWGVFLAAWALIWLVGNAYRKKHPLRKDEDE